MGFPGGSDGKASACSAEDPGSIPRLGRSSGEGNGNPLQYSCLKNSMDWGTWWATVHGVAKSQTRLSDFTFTFRQLIDLESYFSLKIWRKRIFFLNHQKKFFLCVRLKCHWLTYQAFANHCNQAMRYLQIAAFLGMSGCVCLNYLSGSFLGL